MNQFKIDAGRSWKLPPLILHPFTGGASPDKLSESSRASLMLQGLLPNREFTLEELDRRVVEGRFQEIRMLCYVGRDLDRWIVLCMEFAGREEELKDAGLRAESFAALLAEDPPESVRKKLQSWGVVDHRAIFTRALGVGAVFVQPPDRNMLADDFIRHHYRFADQLYLCRQQMCRFTEIRSANFQFEMYASGEYARILEKEWERG